VSSTLRDTLTLRYGPNRNGKYVIFASWQHRKANECCRYSALADLLLYEEELGPGPKTTPIWFTDLNDESPFLFHKPPGQSHVPIDRQGVSRDLIAALVRVGSTRFHR
jgi:hypothetical protein